MKKILYILCAMLAFASCSKEELPTTEGGQNPDGSYTFKLGIEEPDYAPKTRAAVTMGRYMLEMYEGDRDATPIKMENTNGIFNVELQKGVDYVCLFWADNGETAYDAWSLQRVTQTDDTVCGTVAYCGKVTVNSTTFNGAVTLKRAVAELSFIDKNGLVEATNSLKITYPYSQIGFDVSTGSAIYIHSPIVRTISNIAPPADKSTAFATDFVLAPTTYAFEIPGIKFQLNAEVEKGVSKTTTQANYKTKITGEYWKPKAKIGDFYMSDGTWLPGTTTLTPEQQAACIGIVYWTGDPTKDDAALKAAHPTCTNGLVVALKEDGTSAWQSTYLAYRKTINEWTIANTTYAPIISGQALTDPINKIMGYNNTKAIEAFNAANSAYKVEAIEKVAAYQTAVPTPASNSGWFLPSMKELTLLCGLGNQDHNVYDMHYGTDNRDVINARLAKITGSTRIGPESYWSSTESTKFVNPYGNLVWLVQFFHSSSTHYGYKFDNTYVRVVSAF